MTALLVLSLALTSLAPAELEERGRNHLYNIEFAEARELFSALSRVAPKDPAGPYYEATTLWMQELTRRGGMAGATFRSGRFWSRRDQGPPSPELDEAFRSRIAESIERADALLARDPDDIQGLFFMGSAEGLTSAYEAALAKSYYRAYRAGKKARELHERLLTLDPDYADACLLPGVFQYTVATLPRTLRIAGFFVGLRGSREEGMALVERAVASGQRTQWVARLSLSVMLQREKKYSKAVVLLRELEKSFPRNPLLPLERGSIYLLQRKWSAARRVFLELMAAQGAGKPNFNELSPSLLQLRVAESYLFARNPRRALLELDRALEVPDIAEWIRATIYFRRGMASDAMGAREPAEADYRRVLAMDVDDVINKWAERYLARAYSQRRQKRGQGHDQEQ